ncbi:hypothetical protein JCM8097_000458 [Rhodosporidiobolus ruineniae]
MDRLPPELLSTIFRFALPSLSFAPLASAIPFAPAPHHIRAARTLACVSKRWRSVLEPVLKHTILLSCADSLHTAAADVATGRRRLEVKALVVEESKDKPPVSVLAELFLGDLGAHYSMMAEEAVPQVLRACPELRSLTLSNGELHSLSMVQLPSLCSLHLHNLVLDRAAFPVLPSLQTLILHKVITREPGPTLSSASFPSLRLLALLAGTLASFDPLPTALPSLRALACAWGASPQTRQLHDWLREGITPFPPLALFVLDGESLSRLLTPDNDNDPGPNPFSLLKADHGSLDLTSVAHFNLEDLGGVFALLEHTVRHNWDTGSIECIYLPGSGQTPVEARELIERGAVNIGAKVEYEEPAEEAGWARLPGSFVARAFD